MTLSRRSIVTAGLLATTGVTLSPVLTGCDNDGADGGLFGGGFGGGGNRTAQESAGRLIASQIRLPDPFAQSLPVPPVLVPTGGDDAGTDHYEIRQRAASMAIVPGARTGIWGYNGLFPGPTILSRRGRRTVVRHHNELPVPVVVHLHGGLTTPEHDGYPTDVIDPGAARDYVYDLTQPAATLWYHDHRLEFTGPQVYRGLAGFHLVHDDAEDALGLPSGDRDVPLMITDRSFTADGSFRYPSVDPTLTGTPGVRAEYLSGVLGDCILVNGAAWPVLEVSTTRYRLRLLNASNARRYRLRLEGGPDLVQIGSDQGLLPSPVRHEEIDIASGERFDVVVDFGRHAVGDEITLVNDFGADGTDLVMRFRVTREEPDTSRLPDPLVPPARLQGQVGARRQFVLARGGAQAHGMRLWTVNGEPFHPDTVAATVRRGVLERWTIRARNVPHPFHLHLAAFQVIGREGNAEPGRFDGGWKDTVDLGSGDQVEFLVRFDGPPGRYLLHCHNLEHEDMMMMATVEVV